MADGSLPGPAQAALSALTGRRWKLGPARNKVSVERGVAVTVTAPGRGRLLCERR
jgi:hypothetical protein